jgi:hypothetical protein
MKYHALIDSGTTSYVLIDEECTHHHHLPLHLFQLPRNLTVIDERPVTSGAITHIICTYLATHNHQENILPFVTKLGHPPIVLGIPWL